jgi:hypothetical protein
MVASKPQPKRSSDTTLDSSPASICACVGCDSSLAESSCREKHPDVSSTRSTTFDPDHPEQSTPPSPQPAYGLCEPRPCDARHGGPNAAIMEAPRPHGTAHAARSAVLQRGEQAVADLMTRNRPQPLSALPKGRSEIATRPGSAYRYAECGAREGPPRGVRLAGEQVSRVSVMNRVTCRQETHRA